MRNTIIATFAAALLVLSAPAFANGSGSNANANAGAFSSSAAGAASHSSANSNQTGTGNAVTSVYQPAPASSFAPPLVATPDTCMGSTSIGGQGMSFGFAVGTTWTDHNCERLKNSREIRQAGYKAAADALLCMNSEVRDAMKVAGTLCPQDVAPAAAK
jgi:hypothetical protein